MGVANCYVARITCNNDFEQTGYCRQAIDESFEKVVSTISVIKPIPSVTFFFMFKDYDCPLIESEFRQNKECEQCNFGIDPCELLYVALRRVLPLKRHFTTTYFVHF